MSNQCKNLYRFVRLCLGEKISDREIARRWDMDWRSFSNLKHGTRRIPRIDELEQLAGILGVDAALVFEVARGHDAEEAHKWISEGDYESLAQVLMRGLHKAYTREADNEARLRAVLDRVNDAVFTIDVQGCFRDVNQQMCKLAGLERSDLLEATLFDLVPPSLTSDLLKLLSAVYDKGEIHDAHLTIKRSDGTASIIEISATRIDDADYNPRGVQAIARDVTARLNAEAEARTLATIFDSSADAIIHTSSVGTVVHWNPGAERLLGYTPEEIIGEPISILAANGLRDGQRAIFSEALAGEPVLPVDTVRVHKDGSLVDVSMSVFPVLSEQGKVESVCAIARDISQRKQAENRANKLATKYQSVLQAIPDLIFVLDPMLATGGSAAAGIQRVKDWGAGEIRMLSIIAAPEGIAYVREQHPDVSIYVCGIDEELNDEAYILPGLGDAGDRIFNTLN